MNKHFPTYIINVHFLSIISYKQGFICIHLIIYNNLLYTIFLNPMPQKQIINNDKEEKN